MRTLLGIVLFMVLLLAVVIGSAVYIAGYSEHAKLSEMAGYGSNPALPPPDARLLPTIHFAKATGWTKGAKPIAAKGLVVTAFAEHLAHPRWLYVLPNGDVLVAET